MTENQNDDKTWTHIVLTKGTMVSHYRIIEKIGAGGMGEVYLAEDTKLSRRVALKFLPLQLVADPDAKARFTREAQAAAKLSHPNIITIYEVSEYQGRPYFAMEHVEGQPLRDVIKGNKLPLDKIVDLTIQICEGLSKAHQGGLVHRDIKPSNIIIDADGRAKVLDFGLAVVPGAAKLTKTGLTLGTIGYMSPEQVRGEQTDARSDLFSLGIVLYEMIAGRAPFKADTEAATLHTITSDTPQPLARYRANVSDGLQAIIDKALEKDIETRYQTATGFLSDLKREKKVLESREVSASVGRAAILQPRKRLLRILLLTSMSVIVILSILIIKPWKFEISPKQESVAVENRLAIMYFENLADTTDSQRLGEIAANLLITDLSASRHVKVISSQKLYDALKLLGKVKTKVIDREVAFQVAEKVHARWMLMGTILQVTPSIVVTAQLVEVTTGNIVTSHRIESQPAETIFELVDRLTVDIKGSLPLPGEAVSEPDPQVADVTTHSDEAYRYYLEGMDYIYRYLFSQAAQSFRQALDIDSTFAMAYVGLTKVWGISSSDRLEAIMQAMNHLDRVTEKERQLILATYASLSRRYEEAINRYEEIISKYPDEKEAYYELYWVYKALNNREKAINCLLKIIEIDPLFPNAYNRLAYDYCDVGEFKKSLWAVNKYIELVPQEPNPYDTRGDLYAKNGQVKEAISSYLMAIDKNPNFVRSRFNLGAMYLHLGDYANAESQWRIYASHPGLAYRASGRTYLLLLTVVQGKFAEALRLIDIAVEADLLDGAEAVWTVHKLLLQAHIHEQLKDYSSAVLSVSEAEKLTEGPDLNKGTMLEIMGYLSYLYKVSGDLAKARSQSAQLRDYVKEVDSAGLSTYYFYCGRLEYADGHYDSAATYFKRADQIYPTFSHHLWLARSYFAAGHLGDGVAMFEKALSWHDEDRLYNLPYAVKANYWLALAYEESGWDSKAIQLYDTFLTIWKDADPGIDEIEDAKERLAHLRSKS